MNDHVRGLRRRFYPLVISPAIVIPIITGVRQWQEDPAHGLGFLLARFLFAGAVSVAVGCAAGFLTLHFIFRK